MSPTTTAARTPQGLPTPASAVGRALRTELRLNGGRVAGTLVACAVALLWALLAEDQLAGLLVLWAALGWYRYGRTDTVEREELRASLGLSRADRVRGRLLVIGVEHAAVILTVAGGALISVLLGRETGGGAAPFSFTGDPSDPQIPIMLTGALFSMVVLVISGALVGGECTVRRPGRSMAWLSILTYVLVGVLLSIPAMLTNVLAGVEPGSSLGTAVQVGSLVIGLAIALLWLRAAARRWIRDLDSGRRGR